MQAPSSPLVVSMAGDVRIGPLMAIPHVLSELGVTPRRAFTQAGVRLRMFRDPENRVPFADLSRLLSVGAALTGCDHFGILVGERFRLEALGAVGRLMRNSATVGEALRSLQLHLHLQDRGAVPVLVELGPSSVLLGYSAYGQEAESLAQIYDAAITIGHRLLQELCGPAWRPIGVQFSHVRPRDVSAHRRLFRCGLRFDADACGVVFDSSWLDRPIAGADPALHRTLARVIAEAEEVVAMTFAEQVECAMQQLVLNGATSAADVSRIFGVHERTLRKRLRADGTHLQHIVDRTRSGVARHLLRDTRMPIAEIAAVLHYSDPNVFSRAFRGWTGASPRQWRTGQSDTGRPRR